MTSYKDPAAWCRAVAGAVEAGGRFAGAFAMADRPSAVLVAIVDQDGEFHLLTTSVAPGPEQLYEYPSLSVGVPPAFWYERAMHDLSGVTPSGHPRLDPLLLAVTGDSGHPLHPMAPSSPEVRADVAAQGPVDVTGHGVFTVPFGPVRSGVGESVEFLLETPGEDVAQLNIRLHFKHRGVAKRFEGLTPADGVLVAERVEGIASVAHALAFSHAIESAAHEPAVGEQAALFRVVWAELERIANHLDVATKLCDAAGLAVATSRFGWHKEMTMRIMSRLTGSRFGRGAVVPGGVRQGLPFPSDATQRELDELAGRIHDDARRLMTTPSFLDRIRGTGRVEPGYARRWALLGPVGRASGQLVDDRIDHPYDAYPRLSRPSEPVVEINGDARARLEVRLREIDQSFEMIREADSQLRAARRPSAGPGPLGRLPDGMFVGCCEAPQGEALHVVVLGDGKITRCFARSASLHDLVAFRQAFHTDVFTDFAFIEASFGLGYAGVAM